MVVDKQYQSIVKDKFEEDYIERERELKLENKLSVETLKKITFIIGNRYDHCKNITSSCQIHSFTPFVELKDPA